MEGRRGWKECDLTFTCLLSYAEKQQTSYEVTVLSLNSVQQSEQADFSKRQTIALGFETPEPARARACGRV